MYCPSCGKTIDTNVRFCSSCGAQVGTQAAYQQGSTPPPPTAATYPRASLIRPRYPRMIGGVCAAFALQYGWDISLVRVITAVIAILTSGIGGLAYLAAWIIIPEAPYELPYSTSTTPGNPAP